MRISKHLLIPVLLTVAMIGPRLDAQDPGIADTLRLGTDSCSVKSTNPSATVPVFLFNDEGVSSVTLPLLINGFSGWATLDSISYSGSRLEDPAILDTRQFQLVVNDTIAVAKWLITFTTGGGTNLPAGGGKLCELWFRPRFGGTVVLDTCDIAVLILADETANVFAPQFESGEIEIACDYLAGDTDYGSGINSLDVLRIHKCLLGHFWGAAGWLQSFDLNCDRRMDLRDVNDLVEYVFYAGPPPCACGGYSPGIYNDPGLRDTLSFNSDTLYVGISKYVDFNLFNDEIIQGFSFAWEWDGTASVTPPTRKSEYSALPRINPEYRYTLTNYMGLAPPGTDPGGFTLSSWTFEIDTLITPGSGPIFTLLFTPLAPGTLTFRLVHYEPPGNSESMLTGMENTAIVPVFVSGTITVLPYLCGDADKNGLVNISDVVFLINYIFSGGAAPNPIAAGDANCSGIINISDAVYLINYVFGGGPAPCAACP